MLTNNINDKQVYNKLYHDNIYHDISLDNQQTGIELISICNYRFSHYIQFAIIH